MYHKGFFETLPYLFRCDGKCNNNDGDDQEWFGGSDRLSYIDKNTGEHRDVYPMYPIYTNNPIYGEGSISSCFWKAGWAMERGTAYYVDEDPNVDHVKMELCKPFKKIIENCTIPMSECIEDIAIKEIVMAEMLKKMVAKTKRAIEIIKNATQPDFLGGFSHNDCTMFGGDVAGASLLCPSWGHIVTILLVIYFFMSNPTQ